MEESYLGLSDPERDLKTESGFVYDLASVVRSWEWGRFYLCGRATDIDRPVTDFFTGV